MCGFEPRISGVGSDHSTQLALFHDIRKQFYGFDKHACF